MTLEPAANALLAGDEPPAWRLSNPHGQSPYLLICDHAGAAIPRCLGDLGLPAHDRRRHIAWDIGAAAVAAALGEQLDACVVTQTYSRLVIDCNRPLGSPGSIVTVSEDTPVAGNVGIGDAQIAARQREIFQPYHQAIREQIERRQQQGRTPWLICVHSFTPVFRGVVRSWHAGVLYNRDPRLARAMLVALREEGEWVVGDNEPYAASDTTDYAIPIYGEGLGLPHVGIEIRQDLIADAAGQEQWARRLAGVLRNLELAAGWLNVGDK
jgi:predicted N-formylglutamate amidohydrolase